MLILSRKRDESIIITTNGTEIEIVVCNIDYRQNRVQLGFKAAKEVKILRREITRRAESGAILPRAAGSLGGPV